MAVITIGAAAVNGDSGLGGQFTDINIADAANDTGKITSFEAWVQANATGCKIGTFSGSGITYTSRDVEVIGNIVTGSKQTFSGLNCDVVTGDFVGAYMDNAETWEATDGVGSTAWLAGDQFGTGSQSYATIARRLSVYGVGTTVVATPRRNSIIII